MKAMPLQPKWLKADVAGPTVGVDRPNRMILGYVVAQEGPFKTPGRGEFDGKGLRAIVKLMKATPKGLKSRFTHPSLSDDGLGKFLGRSKNARLDTVQVKRDGQLVELEAVRADLHLSETAFEGNPNGNLGQYVLDLAEADPDALSSSLVLEIAEEYRLEKDGTRRRDENGDPLPPLWRPLKLHASDVVDTGDAVDGLLSAQLSPELLDGLPDAAVRRGAELLNIAFAGQPREVVQARCTAWLDRYLELRYGDGDSRAAGFIPAEDECESSAAGSAAGETEPPAGIKPVARELKKRRLLLL